VDLSALGAQALAQVEKARKAAAEQLASAMNQKPKLDLTLELDAPKIAIPVPATEDGRGMTMSISVAVVWTLWIAIDSISHHSEQISAEKFVCSCFVDAPSYRKPCFCRSKKFRVVTLGNLDNKTGKWCDSC